jgi:hypothetical protein
MRGIFDVDNNFRSDDFDEPAAEGPKRLTMADDDVVVIPHMRPTFRLNEEVDALRAENARLRERLHTIAASDDWLAEHDAQVRAEERERVATWYRETFCQALPAVGIDEQHVRGDCAACNVADAIRAGGR